MLCAYTSHLRVFCASVEHEVGSLGDFVQVLCVEVCGSVLWCVAECVSVCCIVLQCVAECVSVYVAVCCSVHIDGPGNGLKPFAASCVFVCVGCLCLCVCVCVCVCALVCVCVCHIHINGSSSRTHARRHASRSSCPHRGTEAAKQAESG